jgi:hypothetical protein
MDRPVQVILDSEQRRRARRRAAEQGLTLSGYIVGLVDADLDSWVAVSGAPATIVRSDDDAPHHAGTYIGEAVAARMNKRPDPAA